MTITIYGAGAIGGLAGAYLAKSGQEVLLVDKAAEHVDAMNNHGLRISGAANFTVPVRACRPEQLKGPLGLTLLAVKSQDTDTALDVLLPLAGPDTVVVSMQNGMNAPRLVQRLGAERVIDAFVSYSADWQGPGHVEDGNPGGKLYLGELDGQMTLRLDELHRLMSCFDTVEAIKTDNIFGYLWSKQVFCSLMFSQAVTTDTMADVYGDKGLQPVLFALVSESRSVAEAAGARLEKYGEFEAEKFRPGNEAEAISILDRMSEKARTKVKVRTGPWRDIAVRRRPTEVDYLVGGVVAEGEKRGLPVPLNKRLVAIVKEIERGERPQSLQNLKELERFRQELG